MIVKSTTLNELRVMFSGLFKAGLAGAPSQWKKVATQIKSTSAENTYGWLGKFPQLREWVGDRVIKNMKEFGYTISNKKYEGTVGVDRADIEDDNLGIYNPIFTSMGEEAENHIDRNIFSLLAGGFAAACYDGQYFFDEDHPVNAEVDGSGADTSVSNIVNPLVVDKAPWFLLDTSRALKPLIYQDRQPAEFEAITNSQQDTVFMTDQYMYGVRARRNFGYGFWQMAVGCRDELNAANFNAAYQKMCEMEADGGEKLGLRPTLLVVPPSLRAAAQAVINAQFINGGDSNINFKAVEVLDVPWLG